MGQIADKKWKRRKKQTNPTNPSGKVDADMNDFDIDEKTIRRQQNKK